MNIRLVKRPRPLLSWVSGGCSLLAALFLAGGCSSGGGDGPGGGQFVLQEINVAPGQIWQINRPIEFVFSRPVDFDSVSMNTLNIAELSGGPAVGEFRRDLTRPNLVTFQPTCPTQADFSDAGLKPGGTQYRITVPDTSNGATTIQAENGSKLGLGLTSLFSTPLSTLPAELFIDTSVGPPSTIPGFVDEHGIVRGTRIQLTDGDGDLFEIPFVLTDGIGRLAEPGSPDSGPGFQEFEVPLNLYSDASSRFAVIVEIDQAVSPAADNIQQSKVQFQFQNAGAWIPVATSVTLAANCTTTGSSLELRPLGVLPQARPLRILITPEFEDIVGDRNILAQVDFATMTSSAFTDSAGNFIEFADELLEEFLVGGNQPGSFEDTDTVLSTPRADWGGGALAAAFDFNGTGGPNGDFDWFVAPNSEFVLDTVSSVILGGPNGVPTNFQVVVNGVVDVRNLYVPATSSIRIQGENPAFIQCSGICHIDGAIRVNGANADSVFTLDTPTQPETGASGNGGGGDGGTGSLLTTQITRMGGPGFGAFNQPGGGGMGGESGWHPNNSTGWGFNRRCAGGGGGTFGPNVVLGNGCFDQTIIGLDAESGMPGEMTANSAIRLGEVLPWGGREATRPFNDTNGDDDDFLGVKLKNFGTLDESLVAGELLMPWAGSGGGAGGDATWTDTYPPAQLIPTRTDKGAGGGGGAGALTIYALGDIIIGQNGKLEAIGGHGNGGENTNFVNRVGGGSGGGAGGHIILHTASKIDLSLLAPGTVAINAKGGQGGEGNTGPGTVGSGGADTNGETSPAADSKHVGVTGPGDLSDNPWIPPVPTECQFAVGVVRACGGDGGPGVIQMHVGQLPGDILYPNSGEMGGNEDRLFGSVKPHPHGYTLDGNRWVDQLLPAFGRFSTAQTEWIPLGGASFGPESETPQPIEFLFEGTDPMTGFIQRDGTQVAELSPLLAPATPIEGAGLPDIDPANPRALRLDASELTGDDAIYRNNPNLLRRFRVTVDPLDFDVQSAVYEEATDVLVLTMAGNGPELPEQGLVQLVPRFFMVRTSGMEDFMPASAEIRLEFQATSANLLGQPDVANIVPGEASPETGGWGSDIDVLNIPDNLNFRFYRFRITFDIQADGGSLTGSTPRSQIDFLRLPFRF